MMGANWNSTRKSITFTEKKHYADILILTHIFSGQLHESFD